ncbi:hypothetical protein CROQUDRAFT_93766 [Cronartium quercuum f. sp. fusiforme G11]|uniref:Uncharacterized protein n=1 Tax=Cronartium quercuum f. sp. fusiforme G11 TaxID=708437 RepID=A0A9P6NK51_9BASI|nr:hypothetical protein CROQUDRAFT_93766 [Cronartium quercuum f. sp. fusiforme G11]
MASQGSISPSQPAMQRTARWLHVIYVNQALSKIAPKNLLNDPNLYIRSSEIRDGLDLFDYEEYLKSDDIKDEEESIIHEVVMKCITTWLLQQMDAPNRTRFEPKICRHHAGRSNELRFLLEREPNLIIQAPSTPLPGHLETFPIAATKYMGAGGNITEEVLGQKLLIFLNDSHFENAKAVADANISKYNEVLAALKKGMSTVAMLRRNRINLVQRVNYTAKANAISKPRFNRSTRKKCLGINLSPDLGFKKPRHEHMQRECIKGQIKLRQ